MKSTFAATRRTFLKRTGIVAGTTALAGAGAMAFLSHATSSVFAASASNTTNAHPSAGAGINVLLVHGAFVDASSWNKVIPLLQAQGFNVLTAQLPMTSIADDVAVTNEALAYLATTSTPTILVGHSYGGVVISNAGLTGSNVRGLVYIVAFAPDSGETVQGLIGQFPATPVGNALVPSFVPNALWITPSAFPSVFMQDVDATEAQTDALTQKPWALPCLGTPSGTPTWKSVPPGISFPRMTGSSILMPSAFLRREWVPPPMRSLQAMPRRFPIPSRSSSLFERRLKRFTRSRVKV